jgi:hypothetical protein
MTSRKMKIPGQEFQKAKGNEGKNVSGRLPGQESSNYRDVMKLRFLSVPV